MFAIDVKQITFKCFFFSNSIEPVETTKWLFFIYIFISTKSNCLIVNLSLICIKNNNKHFSIIRFVYIYRTDSQNKGLVIVVVVYTYEKRNLFIHFLICSFIYIGSNEYKYHRCRSMINNEKKKYIFFCRSWSFISITIVEQTNQVN